MVCVKVGLDSIPRVDTKAAGKGWGFSEADVKG